MKFVVCHFVCFLLALCFGRVFWPAGVALGDAEVVATVAGLAGSGSAGATDAGSAGADFGLRFFERGLLIA